MYFTNMRFFILKNRERAKNHYENNKEQKSILYQNNKEFLSPSLKKFKQLLDSEKNNLVYSMEIQKAINEISKV